MGALARLSVTSVDVQPGASASLTMLVRNVGTVVDEFSFEALGPAGAWTRVEPPSVSLFPQAEQAVTVIFAPPRDPATAPGPTLFGIRVASREDPSGTAVEEGTVDVRAFSDVLVELSPRVTRVRRRSRVEVMVANRSNVPFEAELGAADGPSSFRYRSNPPVVDVAPGAASRAKVTLSGREWYWRGPSTTEPLDIVLRQPEPRGPGAPVPPNPHPPEVVAQGTAVRDAVLPQWLPKAVVALLALILLAGIFWFKMVKPQINGAVQNQVHQALNTTTTNTTAATTPVSTTSPTTTATTAATGNGTTTTPKTKGASSAPVSHSHPINDLLTAGNNSPAIYTVPKGDTLAVTDFLLENSAGDNGNITLSRNGVVLMSWSLDNFRDLDYHWITPIYFTSTQRLVLSVTGCQGSCKPALYYAGTLTSQ
ncbi:MAG TPA: hypothetical protein VME46_02715 [Acidimicrobiales bacterium]|nr:hypothetical protein [Acidimicrobiales bacterium]